MNELNLKAFIAIQQDTINLYKKMAKENSTYNYTEEISQHQDIIDACTKQIAKKPKELAYKLLKDNGWDYECPACGCAVGENKNAEDYTQEDDYCPSCGQKLKWN